MTTPGDDQERRLTSVEQEVRAQRQETARAVAEAGAARVLAAGADKDTADIRVTLNAQVGLLNALHETQQEHTRRFDQLDERFGQIDERFGQMDERFGQIDERFGQVDERFGQIDDRFGQMDERFGQIDDRFGQMDERFGQIDERFGQIDAQFGQVDRNFVSVQEQFVTVHAGIAQIVRLLTPGDATA